MSTIRPDLISRSVSLPIASIKAGVGPFIGCEEMTMDMKRMENSCLCELQALAHSSASLLGTTIPPAPDRHRRRKKIARVPDRSLLPQHDQRIGAVRHQPPLRVVVGLE